MTEFVCHGCFERAFVSVKPISEQEKYSIAPPITSSTIIHFNFSIQHQFWYIQPNNLESVYLGRWDGSTKSTKISIYNAETNLYQKLDHAISQVFTDEFEDQHDDIIEVTTRELQSIVVTKEMSEVTVNVTLVIDHECDGRILLASSADGMVAASKSSIECLEPMEAQERNSKDECMVCLDDLGKETQALRMPCSHVFHAQCITKWLQNSHYCPLCRYEMPTD